MQYKVIFFGEIAIGWALKEVKKNLSVFFKIDAAEVEKLFSGKPIVIKDNIDHQMAAKIKTAMEKAGALCQILEVGKNPHGPFQKKTTETAKHKSVEEPMVTCPKCGFEQKKSAECIRCGIIFRKSKKNVKVNKVKTRREREPDSYSILNSLPERKGRDWLPAAMLGVVIMTFFVVFFYGLFMTLSASRNDESGWEVSKSKNSEKIIAPGRTSRKTSYSIEKKLVRKDKRLREERNRTQTAEGHEAKGRNETAINIQDETPVISSSANYKCQDSEGKWYYADSNADLPEFCRMVLVEGGCFNMGDTFGDGDRDENPVHQVCLDDFYMDRHEVTRSEYQLVTGLKPIKYKACDSCPANGVSWFEAKDYCDQVGKRLPTEAEWEYAARSGGRKVKYATPNGQLSEELANYNSDKIMPVESYPPNPLGLYDMSGNVWEWVNDRYNARYYMDSPTNNPEGPSEGYKESRVLRGGSWRPPPHWVRSSELRVTDRYCYNSKMHNRFNGFRCAESK